MVSIIVPIFNTGKSAAILIDCLLQQSYENLEVILVDDGSTDKSGFRELERMAKRRTSRGAKVRTGDSGHHAAKVRFYHKRNGGAASARNFGLKKARGEFVAFIDSDDLVTKDFIEKLAKPLVEASETEALGEKVSEAKALGAETSGAEAPEAEASEGRGATLAGAGISKKCRAALSVCGFRYIRLKEGKVNDVMIGKLPRRRKSDSDYAYLLRLFVEDGRFYSSVNKMYRMEVIRENELEFDETLEFAEDTDFVVRYLRAAGLGPVAPRMNWPRVAVVREALYIYNFGTETSTVRRTGLEWENWRESLRRFARLRGECGESVPKRNLREWFLLQKLHLRFFVSHILAVERSGIPEKEKRKYVRPLSRVKLVVAKILVRVRK